MKIFLFIIFFTASINPVFSETMSEEATQMRHSVRCLALYKMTSVVFEKAGMEFELMYTDKLIKKIEPIAMNVLKSAGFSKEFSNITIDANIRGLQREIELNIGSVERTWERCGDIFE